MRHFRVLFDDHLSGWAESRFAGEINLLISASPIGQNGHRFADDIWRCIFVNEKVCILSEIFVIKAPIDNNSALV